MKSLVTVTVTYLKRKINGSLCDKLYLKTIFYKNLSISAFENEKIPYFDNLYEKN
jgi:hypothetical protein